MRGLYVALEGADRVGKSTQMQKLVKRLKALEDENRKLKTLVADLTLDKQALQHLLGKKW